MYKQLSTELLPTSFASQAKQGGYSKSVDIIVSFQDILNPKDLAAKVTKYIIDQNLSNCVEECERTKGFKIKLNIGELPSNISNALRNSTRVGYFLKNT